MSSYNQVPFQLSCPISAPISIPFPTGGSETGAIAVQDGTVPQIITTVTLTAPDIARFAVAFDRLLPPLPNTIPVTSANPTPPGLTGSTTIAPGSFSGVQVVNTNVYTLTAGISLFSTAGLVSGALLAEIVLFPGGVGTNTPTTLAAIPLNLSVLTELQGFSLLRGTVRIADIPLAGGDVVQIQIIQTSDIDNGEDLIIDYAWLEIES